MATITEQEDELIKTLIERIKYYNKVNSKKKTIYESKNPVLGLNIAVPKKLKNLTAALGWGKLGVDSVCSKIIMEGWQTDNPSVTGTLNRIFDDNFMMDESSGVTLDTLRYGTGFVMLGRGDVSLGEPKVLITAESPFSMTTDFSLRKRRATAALQIIKHENSDKANEKITGLLLTDHEVIEFTKTSKGYTHIAREVHGFGRVPVIPVINNRETGSSEGHSEITPSMISLINSAMRTLQRTEIAAEFFSHPQRYILGLGDDDFTDSEGQDVNPIQLAMDKILLATGKDGGSNPIAGTFTANSPKASIDLIETYARIYSSEALIPHDYMGFSSGNPTSAEAIQQNEVRLVTRVQERINSYSRPWAQVAALAYFIETGEELQNSVTPVFKNPKTFNLAQVTDAIVKQVQAGVLPADSEVVLDRLGYTRIEKEIIYAERNKFSTDQLTEALVNQTAAIEQSLIDDGLLREVSIDQGEQDEQDTNPVEEVIE